MFVVGSSGGSSTDQHSTELLDTSTLMWTEKKQYPYETKIYAVRSLFHQDQFIAFGGHLGQISTNRIAAYNPQADEWSLLGQTIIARSWTSVVETDNTFLIVGGLYMDGSDSSSNSKLSEKCRFNDRGDLICETQTPLMPAGGKYKS